MGNKLVQILPHYASLTWLKHTQPKNPVWAFTYIPYLAYPFIKLFLGPINLNALLSNKYRYGICWLSDQFVNTQPKHIMFLELTYRIIVSRLENFKVASDVTRLFSFEKQPLWCEEVKRSPTVRRLPPPATNQSPQNNFLTTNPWTLWHPTICSVYFLLARAILSIITITICDNHNYNWRLYLFYSLIDSLELLVCEPFIFCSLLLKLF